MIVNLIVICWILILGEFFKLKEKDAEDSNGLKRTYIFWVSLILILQSGLRHVAVGEDTYQYLQQFNEVKRYSWDMVENEFKYYFILGEGKDPGYTVLQKYFQEFSNNYQVYLFFIAILFFSSFGYFVYKNSKSLSDVILSYFVYSIMFYTFYSYTGIRQTIAMAIILFSYEWIKKRKLLFFIILILLASLIHKSALIMFVFYFFTYIKQTKKLLWISIILFPLLVLFSSRISTFFIEITNSYSEYEEANKFAPINFTILMVVFSIVVAYFHDIIIKDNKFLKYYYVAFSFALFFLAFVFEIHGYMRMVQYFSFFLIVFIPALLNGIEKINPEIKHKIKNFIILILLGLYLKANFSNEVKYAFYWEEMRLGQNYFEED